MASWRSGLHQELILAALNGTSMCRFNETKYIATMTYTDLHRTSSSGLSSRIGCSCRQAALVLAATANLQALPRCLTFAVHLPYRCSARLHFQLVIQNWSTGGTTNLPALGKSLGPTTAREGRSLNETACYHQYGRLSSACCWIKSIPASHE